MTDATQPAPADAQPTKPPKRTAAEIQADLERTRAELSRTVDELADRVDPRAQVSAATEKVTALATEKVELAKEQADVVKEKAEEFVADVRSGQPRALAILGGAVAAVAAVIAISIRKK